MRLSDLTIAAVLVFGTGALVYAQKQASPVPAGTGATTPGTFTLEEVARHASRADCWSVINGGVYDLTSWVPQHPGGEEAILMLCGTDGSATFNAQHGGAPRQAAILAGFKMGELGGVAATAPAEEVEDSSRGRGRGGDDD